MEPSCDYRNQDQRLLVQIVPTAKGAYALLLGLEEKQRLQIGSLGIRTFPPGVYLYLGSAMNGLAARICRHLTKGKRRHWHIDALTEIATPLALWWSEGEQHLECRWAQDALSLPRACVPVRRFGASDCLCRSHLVWFPCQAAAGSFAPGSAHHIRASG